MLKTGYDNAMVFIQQHPANVIVYAGQKKLWEQLVTDKIIIPLNICNNHLEVLQNKFLWNTLVRKLHEYTDAGSEILLVVSHTSSDDLEIFKECFSQEFKLMLEKTINDPHLASLFWFSEHNLSFAQAEKEAHPIIYIFRLIKK